MFTILFPLLCIVLVKFTLSRKLLEEHIQTVHSIQEECFHLVRCNNIIQIITLFKEGNTETFYSF